MSIKHKNQTNEVASSEKKAMPKDLLPKIFSVIAAIVLWLYVISTDAPISDVKLTVGVDLLGANTIESSYGLSPISGAGQSINVVLSGKKSVVTDIEDTDIYAYVDLNAVNKSGSYTLKVMVNAPEGVTIDNYSPREISVYLDKNITKNNVPVRVIKTSYSLDDPSKLSLGEITTDVEYVDVTGPAEIVNSVVSANLNLELQKLSSSTTYTGKLVLVDDDGREVNNAFTSISTPSVTATIPVITTKKIDLAVNFTHGYFNSDNADVKISPSSITVSMPVEMQDELNELIIKTIDETQIGSDTTIQSAIKLPDGVTAITGNGTATINVTLKNTEVSTLTFKAADIKLINIPEGYVAELETSNIAVGVRGPKDTVSKMTASDFNAVVDLSGHSVEGTSSVAVSITSDVEGVYTLNVEKKYPLPTVMVSLKKVK